MIKYFLLIALLLVSGCSVFQPVADKVADAVNRYCEEPLDVRQTLRDTVNKAIAPNQIKVWCNGDIEPKLF